MANIVLPLATLKNDSVSNINVLTENGGTVYRTQSGEIIKQTLGALSETTQSDINGLKFLAEHNGELKKVSYNGSTSSGEGDNSGNFFDVIFYGTLPDLYCNEWIDISENWSTDWTFTDIINEMLASERQPRLTFIDETNNLMFSAITEAITSEYITISTTMCLWGNEMFQTEFCYYGDNSLQALIKPVNPFSDLEFYIWTNSDGDQVLSSNYTYSNLLTFAAMNIYPVQAKCYVDNEFVGFVYLGAIGNGSNNFTFQAFPYGYGGADTSYISYFYQFIMTPDGDVYYEMPTSTYNEQYDILWRNSSDDSVGEIYFDLNPSQYVGYRFTGIWSYTSQDYSSWGFHHDESFTTNGSTGVFFLEGLESNMAGAWLGRTVEIGNNYMKVSNGIVATSDYQSDTIPDVIVPTTILGVKF